MTIAPGRRGGSLVEVVLALALGSLVLGIVTVALTGSIRWMRATAERAEALEVVRTVWVVLDEELRSGVPGRDWWVVGPRTVALRAFRGVARVCPAAPGPGSWTVAYRGRRLPDAMGDSLLVLGADGGWRAMALDRSDPGGGCDPLLDGEVEFRWSWRQEGAPPPILVRLFERGEYHLADGALRYRTGNGGRQPLTPERLGTGSGFRVGDGGLEVTLEFDQGGPGGDPEPVAWSLRAVNAAP